MDIYIEMGGSLVICVVFRGGSLNEGLTQKRARSGREAEESSLYKLDITISCLCLLYFCWW